MCIMADDGYALTGAWNTKCVYVAGWWAALPYEDIVTVRYRNVVLSQPNICVDALSCNPYRSVGHQ